MIPAFFVTDDGPGFTKDMQRWYRDDGHQTFSMAVGSGLWLVRGICEAHWWELHLNSSDEGGARISITGVELQTNRNQSRRY